MKKKTRSELEQGYTACDRELTATRFALHDVILGNVVWFEHGGLKAGLVRPTSASGGVVIALGGFTQVEYLDRWVDNLRRAAITIGGEYHTWMEIANQMLNHRREALAKDAAA